MTLTIDLMTDLLSELGDANLMPYRPERVELWHSVLDDLPAAAVESAVLHIIRTQRSNGRMPTPGDIRAIAQRHTTVTP